jgi:dTDP-4-amino-4,6-dideoxygalactose transaminase
LTNLSAALACAQLEQLQDFLADKRKLSGEYKAYFNGKTGMSYITEPANTSANFWLNAILLPDRNERDAFLTMTNNAGIQTRPIWTLIHKMPMYTSALRGNLQHAEWLEDRVVNLPSSVRKNAL